jgi:hypothetical protein
MFLQLIDNPNTESKEKLNVQGLDGQSISFTTENSVYRRITKQVTFKKVKRDCLSVKIRITYKETNYTHKKSSGMSTK